MNKVISRLHLSDNDVILVKKGTEMAQENNLDALAQAVGDTGVRGIIVIVVDSLNDIRSISADNMSEHGWYKFEDAAALIMERLYKKEQEDGEETKDNIL
jgi:hypothetical protein